jgi:ADP-L-glycero-D-manno-heptose 6-epimerase
MKIIVTGANGFIGRNLSLELFKEGHTLLLVDLHKKSHFDYEGLKLEYLEAQDFLEKFESITQPDDVVFHQGAITNTKEKDLELLLRLNYQYSIDLISKCNERGVHIIYASSASVYGNDTRSQESYDDYTPLNSYAWSKLLVDKKVRSRLTAFDNSKVIGFRYFNVYGPKENEKMNMASPITQFALQYKSLKKCTVFKSDQHQNQVTRDFVFVGDVVKVLIWAMHNLESGIYNLGSGSAHSFYNIATRVQQYFPGASIEEKEFPKELLDGYQGSTLSANSLLNLNRCPITFESIDVGILKTLNYLGISDA